MTRFTFPSPPAERTTILAAMMVAVAWPVLSVRFMRTAASSFDESPQALMEASSLLPGLLTAMIAVSFVGIIVGAVFLYMKSGTSLELRDEGMTYRRPGVPMFGWWGKEEDIPWEQIDKITVARTKHGTFVRDEMRIEAGLAEVVVNLEHAVAEGTRRPVGRTPPSRWPQHRLVELVAQRSPVSITFRR